MPSLTFIVKCVVPQCFKHVEVTVPVDGHLADGWFLAKKAPLSPLPPPTVKGVCPDHAAGEIANGHVET